MRSGKAKAARVEFLALVTVTDKARKEELEKEAPGAESISLNIEDLSRVPDVVALLAVRDTWDKELVDSDVSESESQDSGDLSRRGGGILSLWPSWPTRTPRTPPPGRRC